MRISILDYGVIDEGSNPRQALEETLHLAKEAEKLSFYRFWIAEHHNLPAFAISSPELLMMYLADNTSSIRIGSGGIMGLHYSPYKISESIRTLLALHPHRIDLGLGNSLGTLFVNKALKSIHKKNEYPMLLQEICNYLSGASGNLITQPQVTELPQIYNLSFSKDSAKYTAELGLGYTFGVFPYIKQDPMLFGRDIAKTYRENFEVSEFNNKPQFILAVFVVIADNEEKAEELAKSLDIWMLGKNDFAEFKQFPSSATAKNYVLSDKEKQVVEDNRSRIIVGNRERVRETLKEWANACQATEVLAIPLVPGFENRKRALHLLKDIID